MKQIDRDEFLLSNVPPIIIYNYYPVVKDGMMCGDCIPDGKAKRRERRKKERNNNKKKK